MSDAVALLRLGDIGDPETLHPNLTTVGEGVYALSLFVPVASIVDDPLQVLDFLEQQLGPVLRSHDDSRGVYVLSADALEPEYDACVEAEGGFWVFEPEPEPEPPKPPAREEVEAAAREALATLARSMRGKSAPAKPADPRADAARRYARLAQECIRAAEHLEQTAQHFLDGDVPRASAHRVAAVGHLVRVERELDTLAVVHADHAG